MNKDNAYLYLPLVQALAEGKTIQVKEVGTNAWYDLNPVDFTRKPEFYRIKPESKKMYAIRSRSGNLVEACDCPHKANQLLSSWNKGSRVPYTLEEYVQVG